MPRFHCPLPLSPGLRLALPPNAARHVQVLRLQPGDGITLFDGGVAGGTGGEFDATVLAMGRSDVQVEVGIHHAIDREGPWPLHLAVGVPANERMDWLVEKAAELGVASIQPLQTERCVVRLSAERAERRQAHWQGIAIAACEQCGRNRVPLIHPVRSLKAWLDSCSADTSDPAHARAVLSLGAGSEPWSSFLTHSATQRSFLCGPEGGLSPDEEALAIERGLQPVGLGARVLRAETAALAVLSAMLP